MPTNEDLQQQIDGLKQTLNSLSNKVSDGEFNSMKVFTKEVLMKNGFALMPSKNITSTPTTPNVYFYAGTAYDNTTIKNVVGTPGVAQAAGSWYISTNSTTPGVWNLVGTTWTKLTIN